MIIIIAAGNKIIKIQLLCPILWKRSEIEDGRDWHRRKVVLNKVILFVFFAHKKYFHSIIISWTTDVICTILTMSLLPFLALNVIVALLSMQGQKALGFHQKALNLCFRRSYAFGMTWGWVINTIIFIFGWTMSSIYCEPLAEKPAILDLVSYYFLQGV